MLDSKMRHSILIQTISLVQLAGYSRLDAPVVLSAWPGLRVTKGRKMALYVACIFGIVGGALQAGSTVSDAGDSPLIFS